MNVAFFPYRKDYSYIIRMLNSDPRLHIVAGVIPNGFSSETSSELSIPVYGKVQDVFEIVDTVIFFPIDNRAYLIKIVEETLLNHKNAICYIDFSEQEIVALEKLAESNGVGCKIPGDEIDMSVLQRRSDVYTQQESIIVAVGALTQGMDTSAAVTSLRVALAECGYRVAVVATKREACVLGGKFLPLDRLISSNLDQTIVFINRFFTFFQIVHHPDIIILQLPDEGLHRVSNDYETCFGAKTFLISQAVDIDYSVILSPIIGLDSSVFSVLSEISKQRYGFGYNAIGIDNSSIDMLVSSGTSSLRYFKENEELATSTAGRLREESEGEIVYFSTSEKWQNALANSVIESLS